MACINNPQTCTCFQHVIERDLSPARPSPDVTAVRVRLGKRARKKLIRERVKALKKGGT